MPASPQADTRMEDSARSELPSDRRKSSGGSIASSHDVEDGMSTGSKKQMSTGAQRNEWYLVGVTCLFLLVLTPIWNGILLLQDPAYMYFEGPLLPLGMIILCLATVIAYIVAVTNVFKKVGNNLADEKVLLRLGAVMAMMLSIILMFVSIVLEDIAEESFVEISAACTSGPLTRPLHDWSQALQVYKSMPACSVEETVENCALYEDNEVTRTLKAMENKYKCAGFCYDSVSLSQHGISNETNLGDAIKAEQVTAAHRRATGWTQPVPNTLFSTKNYKYSCDGMTGLKMNHFVSSLGQQCFNEGAVLLLAAVSVGLHVVTEGCGRKESLGWKTGVHEYGSKTGSTTGSKTGSTTGSTTAIAH